MIKFEFADLHCHPTLKTFGNSFSQGNRRHKLNYMEYRREPNIFSIFFQKISGITKFSQSDLTTMTQGNISIAFVSLYPFEKGFFQHPLLNDRLVAFLANIITSVGYNRIRNIQRHKNYFDDFMKEYQFLIEELRNNKLVGGMTCWQLSSRNDDLNPQLKRSLIIPTIEGAHILNTGLSSFGKTSNQDEVINNIKKIKRLSFPPLFITLAHNFNNDLCGHAPSLGVLGNLLDQSDNLNEGISLLGYKVIDSLLMSENGYPIYIDVKHMSVISRKEYYKYLDIKYNNTIPVIVSHGALIGTNFEGKSGSSVSPSLFASETINFYDEEIITIAQTKGLFGVQLDAKRLAPKEKVKKPLFHGDSSLHLRKSVEIIWNQLRHIAEVLDANGYYSWGIATIGSDFDGTINPLHGIWTSKDFNAMANELLVLVQDYLGQGNPLIQKRNSQESALVIIKKFAFDNALGFLNEFYWSGSFNVEEQRCFSHLHT